MHSMRGTNELPIRESKLQFVSRIEFIRSKLICLLLYPGS